MDENQLKQRIVGAIVLVALAVIFIPMLLTGESDSGMSFFGSNIPSQPATVTRVKTLDMDSPTAAPPAAPVPRRPVDEHTPLSPDPALSGPVAVVPPPAEPPVTAPATPASPEPAKGWAVQVGSFSQQSNALGLRDKLRKAGYSAFVEQVATAQGAVYRVRVGPELQREQAERLHKELQAKLKLDGLVVAHP